MAPGSATRSRASLVAAQAMPIIAEDESVAPAVPKRSSSRRIAKPTTPPPVYTYHYTPFSGRSPTNSTLPTTNSSNGTLPDRKPEVDNEAIRRQEWLDRRGGWYRIIVSTFLLVALIVGLSVGLTLGLRKKKCVFPPSPRIEPPTNPLQQILSHRPRSPLIPLPSRELHPDTRPLFHQHILLIVP